MSTYRTKPRVKRSIFRWEHVCDLDIYGLRQQNPHGSGLALDDSMYLVPGSLKGTLVGISKTCFGLHVRQLKTFVSGDLNTIISTKGTIADRRNTHHDLLGRRGSAWHVPTCLIIHYQTSFHAWVECVVPSWGQNKLFSTPFHPKLSNVTS